MLWANKLLVKKRSDVVQKLDELKRQLSQDTYIQKSKILFNDFMYQYLHTYKKLQIRQTTFDKYENLTRNHVFPAFVNMKLQDLKTFHIQKLISEKSDFLAPATVREIHLIIHQALN